jgi:flagellar biosynthesis protein FliP
MPLPHRQQSAFSFPFSFQLFVLAEGWLLIADS